MRCVFFIIALVMSIVYGANIFVQAEDNRQIEHLAAGSYFTDPGKINETQRPLIKGRVQTLQGKYLLSPGDTLSLSIYGMPEFDQENLVIRPDGFVTIKPLGEVEIAGMDVEGTETMLEQSLKHYLKNPQLSLSVNKFHSAIIYVLGAVQKPGAYEIHGDIENPDSPTGLLARGRLTVSNLIANAGGITQRADVSQVMVRNNENNEQQTVDLVRLLKEGDTTQDKLVHSGDTIFVPALDSQAQMDDETFKMLSQSSFAPGTLTVRVLGKVASPGIYALPAQSPGVNSAIASAKGYMVEAQQHKVKVYRMASSGALTQLDVDPNQADFVLRDNDVVVVDERKAPFIARSFDIAQRIASPFLSVGNFGNAVLDIFNPRRRFFFGSTNR